MRVNQNTFHANRSYIVMDGVRVGYLTSLRGNEDFGVEPQYQIGATDPYENVVGASRYELSAAQVTFNRGTLRQLGIASADSDVALRGLVFDVQIVANDGTVLRVFEGVTYASGDIEVNANRVIATNATFRCLRARGGIV